MNNTKTILATAYAINPYKGSEDGMGWNFVMQIARNNRVIAVTRENNEKDIQSYMSEYPSDVYKNIQFIYFDLPYWQRFWKKGGRGAMLYYLLWQNRLVNFIKDLKLQFDISHNLNFHNDWTPSFLWKLNKPMVWGPVGHHPKIPAQYLNHYEKKYWVKDRLTWITKLFFWKYSKSLRKTINKSDHILCMNNSVPEKLQLDSSKLSVMPSVATDDQGYASKRSSRKFTLLSAGRLVPLKGFDLSINAFSGFLNKLSFEDQSKCELIIVGKGPEKEKLSDLCHKLGIQNHVTFIDWIERQKLMDYYRESSAFLFPSHEGAGMVVAEALSFGLPVICLDNSGPGEFVDQLCGYPVPMQDYKGTVSQLSDSICEIYNDPKKLKVLSNNARKKFEDKFHWDRRGESLSKIYSKL